MDIGNVQTLLASWEIKVPKLFVKNITLDSRYVFQGDLFIAIVGHQRDGRLYIPHAIGRGALAVIAEVNKKVDHGYIYYVNNIPIISFYDLKNHLSSISGRFYKHPSLLLSLIGITGTNGKTSVSHLLSQWIHLLCEKSAVMGTLGNGTLNDLIPSVNTTASPVAIQRMLADFYQKGITFVAMEVSSHALVQQRVSNLYFQAAIFTNLTHDHLDYHGNMAAYEAAKWKLFSDLKVKAYIINADDFIGFRWLLKLSRGTAVIWHRSMPRNWIDKWLHVTFVHQSSSGFKIIFDSTWGKGLIHTQLIGRYNVSNLLLALATLLTLNYPLSALLDTAPYLKSICGRMEIFRAQGFPTVVVDYAHTPDALKTVLLEIRSYCFGKTWCIFGCGGDRDKKKRPVMGRIAEKYADNIIITDDNPRTEESEKIIDEIKFGLKDVKLKYVQVIPKREEALITGISQARLKDWVLVAGKGHEDYQIVGSRRLIYSDQSIIKHILGIKK